MENSFIIQDIRIFTGETVIDHGFIHVEGGKIKAVGSGTPTDDIKVGQKLSKPGFTLIPGLIDAHIHAGRPDLLVLQQSLTFGVTTVMDLHNEHENIRKYRQISAKEKDVADFKSAGLSATVTNGWPAPIVTLHDKSPETLAEVATWPNLKTPEDVEKYLDQNTAEGAEYIKLMHESGKVFGQTFEHPTQDLQKCIIQAAHRRGLVTIAHATSLDDTLAVLEAGVDGLAHIIFDQPPTPELISAYKANNAFCNPTLSAIGSITSEGRPIAERFAHDKRIQDLIAQHQVEKLCKCMNFCAETSRLEYAYESVRQLQKAGIDIICGSDAAGPALGTAYGLTMHQELDTFVKIIGFTPEEALRSATSVTARRFGFHDRGNIKEGLRADLVLVEGNPLDEIEATLNLRGVWREGQLHSRFENSLL